MTGKEKELPCSAAGCPLFGDCIVDYEKATKKPKTNADRIRGLNDEELAKWMLQFVIDCTEATLGEDCSFEDGAETAMVNWLKQPAED